MKRYTIVFDELAKMELEDACKYYDCEVPGLGNRFKQEIKRGIQRVRGFPYTWPVEKGDIRRYICHTFPYKILYSIEKNHIYIIAIAHCHRKPDYWIDRYLLHHE